MTGEVSPTSQPPDAVIRASHADRDRTVELLRMAAGDGRLTADELDERLEAALTAKTLSELAVLTTDLPDTPGRPAGVAPPQAKDLVRFASKGGNVVRTGQWVVPASIEAKVTGGNVKLDLTAALITLPTLTVDADLRGGNLILVTRPGILVETDDLTMTGGNVRFRKGTHSQAAVILRVELSGRVRGGNVVVRLPRRSFWQWLTRQPRPYASATA
ncbi:MAG TPA: DUF1707 domain-containing protein [Streptosporangiaceae bacterium]|nr:DUF1707 domain-containing protein [Streptosporangiaceae bacterium]